MRNSPDSAGPLLVGGVGVLRANLAFVACLFWAVSCGSATSSGTAGGGRASSESGKGGASGAGYSLGGANATGGHSFGGSSASAGRSSGGSNAGGSSAMGGTGGDVCGPCPGFACGPPVQLVIAPDASAIAALISDLKVDAPGLELQCRVNGAPSCQWLCESGNSPIADGDYTVTISAPGFASRTLDIQARSPTNCGCCGCCPFSFYQNVALTPSGSAPSSGCCADLDNDSSNCGVCGQVCSKSGACKAGKCSP